MTLKQLVSKVILSGKRDLLWNYLSPLDFSFISRKVESVLVSPDWKSMKSAKSSNKTKDREFDAENCLRAQLPAWKEVNSVRCVLVNDKHVDGEDSMLVRGHEVKLVDIDEDNFSVKYVINSPEDMSANGAVHSLRIVESDETSVTVEVSTEFHGEHQEFVSNYHVALIASMEQAFNKQNGTFQYPYAPRRAVFDNYVLELKPNEVFPSQARSGVTPVASSNIVSDPYRFLENPDSSETKQWIDEQNVQTKSIMDECTSKQGIFDSIKTMYQYRRVGNAVLYGKNWYFSMNDGLQNQSLVYQAKCQFDSQNHPILPSFEQLKESARVFVDPNQFGDNTAISSLEWNGHGKFAFQASKNGSDWKTIHVVSEDDDTVVALGQAGDVDVVSHVKFSGVEWLKTGAGYFYSRYPPVATSDLGTETDAAVNHRLYFHRAGTKQEDDVLVWSDSTNDQWMCNAQVSHCGKYLLAVINDSCDRSNMLWITEIAAVLGVTGAKKDAVLPLPWNRVVDKFEAEFRYLSNDGTKFYFITNLDARKGRVVMVDLNDSLQNDENKHIGECFTAGKTALQFPVHSVIPEAAGVLEDAVVLGDLIITNVLEDVQNKLAVYKLDGSVVDSSLLTQGLPSFSTLAIHGHRDEPLLYITAVSFTSAGVTFTYNTQTQQLVQFNENKPSSFDSSAFSVTQAFAPSEDGETKIPMFLVHRKELQLDGSNPVFLYGYGGFNISLPPSFSPSNIGYLNYLATQGVNGVVAICNLRGGGEYGDAWHEAGTKTHKMNVFRDFKDCAKYLIDNKYTSAGHIGIHGRSNGGLLVGASSVLYGTDFYGAAVASVGVLDMLRFSNFTIGYAWESDYGYVSEHQSEFDAICEYSPYHNIPKKLPPLLVNTASHDDRVSPNHSFKFSAAMQRANAHGPNPAIIRIEVNSGHGAGKPLDKVIQEQADIFAFLTKYIVY